MNSSALHCISYGLYVVSSRKGDRLNGQIANTVFQVTSEPATIAVSTNKQNLTHKFIRASRVFSVSVLSEESPLSFIGRFGFKSGRELDKFAEVRYRIGGTGAPIVLDHTLAFLEARVIQEKDVGTHTVFIGEVADAEILKAGPCMTYAYYHEVKRGKAPKTAPTYIEEQVEEETKGEGKMAKYECTVCGYVYDPDQGDPDADIQPGTAFGDLPEDWVCPICGAGKDEFEEVA
ncbi:MAG: rubredoxin [Candidatus Latescibacteria bacterium]|nr:rubredoxin [Candidatus Latescibacterota bacterium]